MPEGGFSFVLHSHLPYARRAGRWPHGEEWLHEAAAETYIPLLNALYDLRDEGVKYKLTIDFTPVLLEQLADPLVIEHFILYLEEKEAAAANDIPRFERMGNTQFQYLATFYFDFYSRVHETFTERFDKDIINSLKTLQDEGYLEIATSCATHGYLPLLERDSSIYAQLKVGVENYRKHFGMMPRSIWLPECGYRPPFHVRRNGDEYYKPGIEAFLADLKIGTFFAETHAIEGGTPVGKAVGDAVGSYGIVPKRYVLPLAEYEQPTHRTTYLPYYVQTPYVSVFGRNNRTGLQVWSGEYGYPGDGDYREFHKKDGVSGMQYWRVTGPKVDLSDKQVYDPQGAEEKILEHATHFSSLVEQLIIEFQAQNNRQGYIAAMYDTELFGHWWFEGIDWIKEVLRRLADNPNVQLATASEWVAAHPPEDVLALPESSWGQAGNHFTWLNADTAWMWPLIHGAEEKMEALVAKYPFTEDSMTMVLDQAARELLLLQSSDWPFLVTTGQASQYATERFSGHLARFNQLAFIAERGDVRPDDLELAQEYFELDNVFPEINYRVFAGREQMRER
jgi:1,4-alpha-glucan branching enzyme